MKKHRPKPRVPKRRRASQPAADWWAGLLEDDAEPRYFHGGVPGLQAGDFILPACVTGARSRAATVKATLRGCSDWAVDELQDAYRDDRVFLTEDLRQAVLYAVSFKRFSGAGGLYLVAPIGEVEPDEFATIDSMHALAVQCEKARIVRVIRVPHGVRQRATALFKRVQIAREAGTGTDWPLLTANLNFT